MKIFDYSDIWWGPPRKFAEKENDRKISWLELFYDLVYVIAIATITHHLAAHFSWHELQNYMFLFGMIYWGWLNGSQHHDLHGTAGLRTMLLTMYQMMIVAALSIVLQLVDTIKYAGLVTIVLMILQLYITYIWWSVGFYDKSHRRYNKPYTVCYLLVFVLMLASLFLDEQMVSWLMLPILVINYSPAFIAHRFLRRDRRDFNLSSSMNERLGLFTIIIFGEAVLGAVNGVVQLGTLNTSIWINFALCVSLIFSLWWIFFALVSYRNCKPGFANGSLFELLYLPTLMALALIGISLSDLFSEFSTDSISHQPWSKQTFGFALSAFLLGICALIAFLDYGKEYVRLKIKIQRTLFISAFVFIIYTLINPQLSLMQHLIVMLVALLIVILILNYTWFKAVEANNKLDEYRPKK